MRALLASRPLWITRNASWAWTAVAAYASDHNLPELSGEAYLLAAEAAPDDDRKSQRLVAAAIHLRGIDQERAIAALEGARALEAPNALYIAVSNTIFSTEAGVVAVWELDPLLTRPSSEVDESVIAQRVLAQRARQAGDLDSAVLHAQNAVQLDDQSPTSLEQLASYQLTRWGLEGSDTSDLTDAIAHLEKMIELSRPWAGPTLSERQELAKAYTMSGRWESTLKLALPPPHGTGRCQAW